MGEKSKYKVLVVDDNRVNCELAKRFLEKSYDIEIAFGGEEAISKIYDYSPAVVLLDIKMLRITGDELVKMIKVWKPEIQVIMVSAHLTPEIEQECMQNGAFGCISKPLDYEHIHEIIQKALNQFSEGTDNVFKIVKRL